MADIEQGVNPGNLRWQPPTENTDGSPIRGALSYNLYRADDVAGLASAAVYFVVVGALQTDGTYVAPVDNFAEGRHVIAMTAVDEQGDESTRSNTLGFEVRVVPRAPFLLAS